MHWSRCNWVWTNGCRAIDVFKGSRHASTCSFSISSCSHYQKLNTLCLTTGSAHSPLHPGRGRKSGTIVSQSGLYKLWLANFEIWRYTQLRFSIEGAISIYRCQLSVFSLCREVYSGGWEAVVYNQVAFLYGCANLGFYFLFSLYY